MLKWISEITFSAETPRTRQSQLDCQQLSLEELTTVTDIVVNEVENQIIEHENHKEKSRVLEVHASRLPDYSWLMSSDQKPKKYLTMQEKFKVVHACERLRYEEFIKAVNNFKARVEGNYDKYNRTEILEIFSNCASEVLATRPRNVKVSDVLKKYTRSGSVNAVSFTTGGLFGSEEVQVGSKSPRQPYSARTYGIYDSIV